MIALRLLFWQWSRSKSVTFNIEDQIKTASDKAMAALTVLKPGFASITAFAWLRDLAIVLLFIAGFDLRESMPRVAVLMMICAAVVFIERVLWSWYLFDLRDQQPPKLS